MSDLEQLVLRSGDPYSPVAKGASDRPASPPNAAQIVVLCGQLRPARGDKKRWFRRACVLTVIFVGAWSLATGQGDAKQCGKHEGAAKAACVKQAKRDAMPWPPRPTNDEIKQRIGADQWAKAERVAFCETGGNIAHYPSGTYIGYLGMYRGTYGLGVDGTKGPGNPHGYRWPAEGATKAEQIAVGYVVAQRFGWSAWGCGGA